MRVVKIWGVLSKLMNQNLSRSKILHDLSELEHLNNNRTHDLSVALIFKMQWIKLIRNSIEYT